MRRLLLICCLVLTTMGVMAQKWEGLADTPQMGWSTWNKFQGNISEDIIKGIADAMVESGLRDAGYVYINIDDCWHGKRDANGFIQTDPVRFPHGMKAVADYVHGKGLKLGIYSDAGTATCAGMPGSLGHEYQDAVQYARWGVDYLKYDWCNTTNVNPQGAYQLISDALRAAGRPILLSMCEWGSSKPWRWARDVGHSWRTTPDIWCDFDSLRVFPGYTQFGVMQCIALNDTLRQYAGRGHWNDPDMLEVGNGMTENEDRAHFTMWCMMASPLILGNDVRSMSEATRNIIMNREMIAVDQDALGIQGLHYCDRDGLQFWFKPLEGGDWAFTILNPTRQDITFELNWQDFNLTDREVSGLSTAFDTKVYQVYNLWTHKLEGKTSLKNKTDRKLTVKARDVISYRLKATEVSLIQNVQAYESMSLNGDWYYIVDVQEEGYYDYRMNPTRWGFFQNAKPHRPEDLIEYDFDKSPTMHIPSDWNTQDERLFFYEGTVWFKTSFKGAWGKGDYRTLLYFGAVNYDCHVYINGTHVGHHIGGFTPFNYDVSDLLKKGENTVIVKVDNKRHAEDVPTQIFDWWNYGGITRDVKLVKVPQTYIEDYALSLKGQGAGGKEQEAGSKEQELSFTAHLNRQEAGHKVTVSIPELKLKQQLTTDADGKVRSTFNVQRSTLQLWSPDSPKRYRVDISVGGDLAASTITDSIGFRTIKTRGKQILLNGKPIFLKGICIHNEKPNGGGRANSVEDARTLLTWAKELGCNFVRLAHYPHHEEMVREAERMGILVWSEIPVYWTIAWNNPKTFDNAKAQLTDMIRRDHNRANVIIWSIANETPHSKERDAFLSRLAQYARTLDDTRLISMAMEVTGASNYVNRLNDNMNKYVDVVSFNQYIGWYRDVNDAPKMRWEIPYDKPVIISEFGGGARYGLHGDKNQRWTEEFQENLYIENLAMIDKIEGLAGTTPWILKDFRSPRRVLPGIQDYYNRKGLVSDKGEKKKAFYVLKQWYDSK